MIARGRGNRVKAYERLRSHRSILGVFPEVWPQKLLSLSEELKESKGTRLHVTLPGSSSRRSAGGGPQFPRICSRTVFVCPNDYKDETDFANHHTHHILFLGIESSLVSLFSFGESLCISFFLSPQFHILLPEQISLCYISIMSHSVCATFDPLATHPFTNGSGLLPKPTQPSKYPSPIPSAMKAGIPSHAQHAAQIPATPTRNAFPVHAPQPKRSTPKPSPATRGPIFVPFRPERSSPDLDDILLRKKVSDALSNRQQTWSIDQAHVGTPSTPKTLSSASKRGAKQPLH